ncbi:MAG: sulfatase-like hydrolase/transferase [Sedimentisphaerales bacterium]|nr:sulfatase-like hydrolase/transferase [Sedimentisphaerales bacterium]
MNRKLITIIVLLAVVIISSGLWFLSRRSFTLIRNVVLISIDTCRSDYLSCYGYPRQTTPNIDAVAHEGILFKNVFTPAPVTLPAHSSMLTGTIPPYHGVRYNQNYRLVESNVTLAEVLKEEGFTTGAVVGSFILNRKFGIIQGFDYYNDTFEEEIKNRDLFSERRGEEVTRFGTRWLQENRDKRFFLFLHYYDPHTDYNPPEPYRWQFSRNSSSKREELNNLYAGEVAYTDYCIGQLINTLKELGVYDDTLLIITSDHGEMLGEHGEEEHGYFIYQSAVKVPLILKIPDRIRPRVIDRPVSLLDIVPTVCGLLGIDYPPQVSGMDLYRTVIAPKTPAEQERYIYCESVLPTYCNVNSLLGVVSGDWKYIQTTRPELYNWRADSFEQHNLIAEQNPRARIMQDRLQQILESQIQHDISESRFILDDETRKRLESLGYVAEGRIDDDKFEFDQNKGDPKDYIGLHIKTSEAAVLSSEGREDRVLAIFMELAEEYPEMVFIHRRLGDTFFSRGDYQKALTYYAVVFKQAPDDFKLHAAMGKSYMETGDREKACYHWQESLRVNSRQPMIYNALAELYYLQGEYQKAIDNWEKALSYQPDWLRVLCNLAWIRATHPREDIRRPAEALNYSLQACELTQFSHPDALNALAAAYAATGQFAEAVETAQKLEQIYITQNAGEQAKLVREKIELYKAGQPFREKP